MCVAPLIVELKLLIFIPSEQCVNGRVFNVLVMTLTVSLLALS